MKRALALLAALSLTGGRVDAQKAYFDPCTPGPYLVLFERGESRITQETARILDYVVSTENYCDPKPLWLSGHIDPGEPGRLARARAEAVRKYLRRHKLATKQVTIEDFGSNRPRVQGSDRQNQRVEIARWPGGLKAAPAGGTRQR